MGDPYYLSGATAANPSGGTGNNIWVASFSSTAVVVTAGTEFQLGADGHLRLPDFDFDGYPGEMRISHLPRPPPLMLLCPLLTFSPRCDRRGRIGWLAHQLWQLGAHLR